ncbi:orotidine-5'-phosphate decarboxylase [Lacipirellula sp.]|uniref:orotidine-5'-phosphate decarboxylase n=1 Tax=Lacipirellula sp. TaxID=2691419 RepID=UPI003D0A7AAD
MLHFTDLLAAAVRRAGNSVCVGLDPRWEQLPWPITTGRENEPNGHADAYLDFCCGVIDVVAPLVPVVKPQMAFFEELGPSGMTALAEVIRYAQERGLLVILDGKRNDIGSTAEAYARGLLGRGVSPWGADCLTVSPYLGEDSLTPFVDVARERSAGLFVLVKTSNPGGGMLQDLVANDQTVYRHVAALVEKFSAETAGESGYGLAGAVVGATYPEQLAELRAAMPHTWFLVPGFGSQGGAAKDVAPAFDANSMGAVINNSRGIIFAHAKKEYAETFGDQHWQKAVEAATKLMIEQLGEI